MAELPSSICCCWYIFVFTEESFWSHFFQCWQFINFFPQSKLIEFYRPHPKDGGKVIFPVCVCQSTWGTPFPSHNTSIHWSHVLSEGTPLPDPMSLRGVPPSGTCLWVPQSSSCPHQNWMGVCSCWDWMGVPPSGLDGVHPPLGLDGVSCHHD